LRSWAGRLPPSVCGRPVPRRTRRSTRRTKTSARHRRRVPVHHHRHRRSVPARTNARRTQKPPAPRPVQRAIAGCGRITRRATAALSPQARICLARPVRQARSAWCLGKMQHRLRLCDALPESEVGAGSPSRLVGSGVVWPGLRPASPARLGGACSALVRLRHVEDPGGLDGDDFGRHYCP